MTVDAIKDRIRKFKAANRLSCAALARKAGLHDNALRAIDTENWNPRSDTLEKLEAVIAREERAA